MADQVNKNKKKKIQLLWIVPHLNESLEVVSKVLKIINSYSVENRLSYMIVVCDGGSSEETIIQLQNLVINLGRNVVLHLTMPPIRPTKNKAIKDVVTSVDSEYTAIIDSDCKNLDNDAVEQMITPIINNCYDVSLPNMTKSGGRVNRLICIPLLKMFFPTVAKKVSYPLSGLIAVRSSILHEIVLNQNYYWDWGGEIQIIIDTCRNNRVFQFHYNKIDDKKRSIESKRGDATHLIRTLFYEALRKTDSMNNKYDNQREKKIKTDSTMLNYNSSLIQTLVISVVEEVLFNRKIQRKQIRNLPDHDMDWLGLHEYEKYLIQIYSNYFMKIQDDTVSLNFFMKNCEKMLKKQNSFSKSVSLDITDLDTGSIREIAEIYNNTDEMLIKSEKINAKYTAWKDQR